LGQAGGAAERDAAAADVVAARSAVRAYAKGVPLKNALPGSRPTRVPDQKNRPLSATTEIDPRYQARTAKGDTMKKTALILATVAALGATAVTAPAEARGRGWGPGPAIGLGIAAGALAAGAYGAYGPYGYGYGPRYYGYGYGPRYAYGPGYYGYYRGPRYYRSYGYY
jgi:hypothetical protein